MHLNFWGLVLITNPFNPMSDQDGISPKKYNYNIKYTSEENGNINWGIISWSNHKFSEFI